MAQSYGLNAVIFILLGAYLCEAWLFSSSSSGSRGSTGPRSRDIDSQSGLTRLYNQRVVHSTGVRRPLGSGTHMFGPLSHSGAVVTTQDGSRWLVHKGLNNGGRGGDTVVTSAKHMSDRWETIPFSGRTVRRSRVGDFVRAGGRHYCLFFGNCHSATSSMLKQQ